MRSRLPSTPLSSSLPLQHSHSDPHPNAFPLPVLQLVRSRLPTEALQALEERLRAVDAFLADYLHVGGAGRAGGWVGRVKEDRTGCHYG